MNLKCTLSSYVDPFSGLPNNNNSTNFTSHKRVLLFCYLFCLVFLLCAIALCSFRTVCLRYGKSWLSTYHLGFHAVAYGFVCLLLFAILSHVRSNRCRWWQVATFSILVTTIIGLLVEVLQSHFGRQLSLLDAVMNGVGACCTTFPTDYHSILTLLLAKNCF
ncbi:hypothetical protein Gasu2_44410 [Galdieria sulphuraria]|nr:hypothetical protein Gasu2_44410 [Galdieria sulphuraria]